MHEHESSICLSSLVIGAVAGAGVALLMAPRFGSVRQPLSGRVREGAEQAREIASRAKERGRHLAEAEAKKARGSVESIARKSGETARFPRDYASVLDYRGL